MRTPWHIGALLVALAACGGEDRLSVEELMDPETCRDCHPKQYREWSGSMHAYAADDPVFLAMNQRGQEEAGIGDFCVNCHAPMAVRLGLTTDGLNLGELPQKYKGVTCYFCHNVVDIEGSHNNPLVLANDQTMRGSIADPVENGVHGSEYSPLLDGRNVVESSKMCGTCHDIVTPAGVHLERTYAEWQDSVFNRPQEQGGLSCTGCHMFAERDVVADFDGVPLRRRYSHEFPGFDVAITDWPEKEAQLAAIERDAKGMIFPRLCVNPAAGGVEADYILDNVGAGHMLPSGAAADRRMWAEITAWDADGNVIFESGKVAEGEPVTTVAETDPNLWQMRDFVTDENGEEAHMFWDVRNVDSQLLTFAVTNDPTDPAYVHTVTRNYPAIGNAQRIRARLHLRPIGLDIMDDLIGTGHLDAIYRERIPTFSFEGTDVEWNRDDGFGCVCTTGPCSL